MLILLVHSALAISITSPIPNYIISPNETYDLSLNDYFSGDYLTFRSVPSSGFVSNSSISNSAQSFFPFNNSANYTSSKLLLMVEINENQIVLIPFNTKIYAFHYNRTDTKLINYIVLANPNLIKEIQKMVKVEIDGYAYVLIKTEQYVDENRLFTINQLYLSNLTDLMISPIPENVTELSMWDIRYNAPGLVVGSSNNNYIPMIYYTYDKYSVFIYDFSVPYSPVLIHSILIGPIPIDSLICDNTLYVVTGLSQLYSINFDILSYNFSISTIIDTNMPISSIKLSNYEDNIILTSPLAFLTVGLPNFTSFYYKNVTNGMKMIYETEELDDFYILLQNNFDGSLEFIISSKDELALIYSILINEENIQWFAFEVNETVIDLIIANQTNVSLFTIFFKEATATISSKFIGQIEIVAYENSRDLFISQSFFITLLDNKTQLNVFYIGPDDLEYYTNFTGLQGTLNISCAELFSAPNLSCALENITYNSDVFEAINYTSTLAMSETSLNISDDAFEWDSMISYGNFLFFYDNITGFLFDTDKNITEYTYYNFSLHKIFTNGIYFYAIVTDYSPANEDLENQNKLALVLAADNLNFTNPNHVSSTLFNPVKVIILNFYTLLYYGSYYQIFDNDCLIPGEIVATAEILDITADGSLVYILTSQHIKISLLDDYTATDQFMINHFCNACTNISLSTDYLFIYGQNVMNIYDKIEYNFIKEVIFPSKISCSDLKNDTFAFFDLEYLYFYKLDELAHSALVQYSKIDMNTSMTNSCELSISQIYTGSGLIYIFSQPNLGVYKYILDGFSLQINGYLKPNANSNKEMEAATLSILASSQNFDIISTNSTSAEINFLINGLTMYENKQAENETVQLFCDTSSSISLSNIITGQNISFGLKENFTSFNIENRISNGSISFNTLRVKFFKIISSTVDIAVSDHSIYIKMGNNILGNLTIDDETFISLAYINTIQNKIRFLTGSKKTNYSTQYWQNQNRTFSKIVFIYRLWEFENGGFTNKTSNLLISPDQIRVLSLVGEEFVAIIFNVFDNPSTISGCKNVVLINHYLGDENELIVYSVQFSYFEINSIYISDFAGTFDPMFHQFYLYFADIYSGIHIFSFNSTVLIFEYLGLIPTEEPILSIILSSGFIYAAGLSSSIYYYQMVDFTLIKLNNQVLYISKGFTPIYSTFVASEAYSPVYLAQLIFNGISIYLQVVDVRVPSFSAILVEKYTPYSPEEILSVQFISNETIAFATTNLILYYQINQGELNFVPGQEECKNRMLILPIIASGTYSSTEFNLHVKTIGSYSSGNIQHSISLWAVISIVGVSVCLVILLPFLYKYLAKKCQKKIHKESLFQYDFKHFHYQR